MFSRCTRIFALLAVTALLGNARCVDNCASVTDAPARSTAPQCPLHKQTGTQPAACDHQHPQFATASTDDVQRLPDLYWVAEAISLPLVPEFESFGLKPSSSPPPVSPPSSVIILRL